jgi:hypothetical protein
MMLHDVIRWLDSQPQISTVFVSQSELSVPENKRSLQADVARYLNAWNMLPATSTEVFSTTLGPCLREDMDQLMSDW